MIRRIYSDLPKFKDLSFKRGLNVLLAEKSPGATDKQTRNRAGKSSLLDIMHFLLGSKCEKDSIFRSESLRGAMFGMEFDLDEKPVRVERSGKRSTPVAVSGDTAEWPLKPAARGGEMLLSNDNWKTVLAKAIFGLEEFDESWVPSFRSLISYFVRRDREGGMEQPMMQSRQQRLADQQISVSFLLGLDWSVAREWQKVRDREKSLEQIRKGMREGAFGDVVGTAAALRSELIVALDKAKRLRESIRSFRVVSEYHDLEREASRLTGQLSSIADENLLDRRYLADLEQTTVQEIPPAAVDLERLYGDAGVVLPGLVRKRFEDVSLFHESVVRNRRAYLHAEIEAAKQRINAREIEKAKLDARRAEIMAILSSSGALEHFMAMQGELTKAEAHAEAIRQRFDAAESLESGDLRLKVERAHLVERLRQDYVEQSAAIEEAVLTFRSISARLYEDDKAGSLTVTPTENGPHFDAHIPGEKSKGVNNMRIFCFDMMLMLLAMRRRRSPGFLVHDSHLFDGVDERQVGKALAVGAELAREYEFQYLVTMNTDDLPTEVPAGFDIQSYALDVRLTDASEDGGLFGFRFS